MNDDRGLYVVSAIEQLEDGNMVGVGDLGPRNPWQAYSPPCPNGHPPADVLLFDDDTDGATRWHCIECHRGFIERPAGAKLPAHHPAFGGALTMELDESLPP